MGDIYRPTVRMDDTFQRYIEDVFHATTLDRNQAFRLMLFTAPLSAIYAGKLREHLKTGHDVPAPRWSRHDTGLYLQQTVDRLHDRVEGRQLGAVVKIGGAG